MAWDVHVISECGPGADLNEDFALADAQRGVVVVADGISGRPGGEHASRRAGMEFLEGAARLKPEERLRQDCLLPIMETINRHIFEAGITDPLLKGMGTTLTAAVLAGMRATIVHLGDSRCYLAREGVLQKVTRDHTVIEELQACQGQEAKAGAHHSLCHMLSRALGIRAVAVPDLIDLELREGDWLVLATDGLVTTLGEEEMQRLISEWSSGEAQRMCEGLIASALARHPMDNLTVAAVRVKKTA